MTTAPRNSRNSEITTPVDRRCIFKDTFKETMQAAKAPKQHTCQSGQDEQASI
jgi:hypothetical protein